MNSWELLRQKAERARLLAAGATNIGIRQEFMRLAERLETAASAEERGEVSDEELIRWPFR